MASIVDGDQIIRGTLSLNAVSLPAACVYDASVNSAASIATTKLNHRYAEGLGQDNGTAVVSQRRTVRVVIGTTGLINSFKASLSVAALGASTVTVKLLKNGVDILSADIVLTSATAINVAASAAGFTSTALAAGDVLDIQFVVVVGGGTVPQGVYAQVCFDESPS